MNYYLHKARPALLYPPVESRDATPFLLPSGALACTYNCHDTRLRLSRKSDSYRQIRGYTLNCPEDHSCDVVRQVSKREGFYQSVSKGYCVRLGESRKRKKRIRVKSKEIDCVDVDDPGTQETDVQARVDDFLNDNTALSSSIDFMMLM